MLCVLLSAGSQAQNWYATGSDAGWRDGEDAVYVPSEGWVVESEGFSSLSTQSAGQSWDTWYKVDEGARKARVTLFPGSRASVLDVGNKTKIGDRKWRVQGSKQQIDSLEDTPEVFSVLPTHPGFVRLNQRSRELIGVDQVQALPQNLTGDGFAAGVWDLGPPFAPSKALAGNHTDLDFRDSKVVAGEQGIRVGRHGTHVTGTLLGAGKLDKKRRGVAPNASAVGFVATGSPSELEEETNKTINKYGGVVSQNSWGAISTCDDGVGDYDLLAESYDKYISNRSADVEGVLTTVFAAGNKRDADSPGGCTQKYNTSVPPATAKNVISVAALRTKTKTASFSSTGPTDDGRIKPDISALGLFVNSTVPEDSYALKSGTSMAAPAVSGGVVLLNEQFNDTNREPAPATTKAILIHTAEDINLPGPDYLSGWGRANISDAVDYAEKSSSQDIIKRGSIERGEKDSYSLDVEEGASFNITVVWSDASAPSGSPETLINDLDLAVAFDGERFYPWTINYSTRSSGATRNKEDHTNNVEQVYIPSAPSQNIEMEVEAESTPRPPQTYSLLLPRAQTLTSPPQLTIQQPRNSTLADKPDLQVQSNEELRSVNFSLGQGNRSLERTSPSDFINTSFNPEPGRSDVTVYAIDTEREKNSSSTAFTYDPFRPNVTVLSPKDKSSVRNQIGVNATSSDNITSTTLSAEIHNRSGTVIRFNPNATVEAGNLAEGNYNLSLTATDTAGNTNTQNISVKVDRTPPQIQALTPGVTSGNISLNASVSDTSEIVTTSFNLSNSTSSTTGQLNQTLNTSLLEDGKYNLSLTAIDAAGNKGRNRTELKIDNAPPKVAFGTENFVSSTFNTTLFIQDSTRTTTELVLKNSTFNRTLKPNSSASTSILEQGNYTLEANVTDSANNSKSKSIEIEIDQAAPDLAVLNPENQTVLTGDIEINATSIDQETSVKNMRFALQGPVSSRNGTINTTVNTQALADGTYKLNITALDKAGNTNSTQLTVTLDNAPTIASTTIPQNGNISGTADINLSFREASKIDTASFTVINTTDNQTATRNINTTLDTQELADGDYNLSVQASDTNGNQLKTNISFTSDNTGPNLSVNLSKPDRSGYHKQNATAKVECLDQTSGVGVINATHGPSSNSSDVNLTVTKRGNNTIEFMCLDQAGNQDSEFRDVAVDKRPPKINGTVPENLSTTERDTDIVVDIQDVSGLNSSSLQLSANRAEATASTDGNAVNIQVNGANPGDKYTLKLSVSDILNQSSMFVLRYKTEIEGSSDDSSGGSGGGGGGGGGGFSTDKAKTETKNEESSEEKIKNETEVLSPTSQTENVPNSSDTGTQNLTTPSQNESQKPSRDREFRPSNRDNRLGITQLESGEQLIEIPGSVVDEREQVLLRQLDGNATATATLVDSEGENLTYRTNAAPAGNYAVVRDSKESLLIPLLTSAAIIVFLTCIGAIYTWRFKGAGRDGDLDSEIELLREAAKDFRLSEKERQQAILRIQEAQRHYRNGHVQKAKEMLEQVREDI